MKAQVNLSRAIGCEFLARKLKSLGILLGIIVFVSLAVAIWLTTVNVWWWLLAVPVILFSILGVTAFVAARVTLLVLKPTVTDIQDQAVKDFVDKFERVAEHVQTPMFILVFRVIRDILRPGKKTFIQSATEDSTTLHKDLAALQAKFK